MYIRGSELPSSTSVRAAGTHIRFQIFLAIHAAKDPALDADRAVGRERDRVSVIHIGLERRQRDRSGNALFAAGDFSAAEAAADHHLDSLGAGLHRRFGTLLENAAETRPLLELLGNCFGHELGVEIRILHLDHRHRADLALDEVFDLLAELVDFSALGSDDQAGPGGAKGDAHFFAGALDEDVADGREGRAAVELLVDELAKTVILAKKLAVGLLGRVPARLPVLGDPDAKTKWIYFLTHALLSSFLHSFAFSPRPSIVTSRC